MYPSIGTALGSRVRMQASISIQDGRLRRYERWCGAAPDGHVARREDANCTEASGSSRVVQRMHQRYNSIMLTSVTHQDDRITEVRAVEVRKIRSHK